MADMLQGQNDVLEGDIDVDAAGGLDDVASAQAELEVMKARLAQMENEAARHRSDPAAGEGGEANARSDAGDQASREEADSRSIYVGNVDYACTPEELQQHFQGCGTVNRVTILTDKFGNPKGFAYLEFLEGDAVANAVLLDNSELRARNIKVAPKRTNVPGMKPGFGGFRGRGFSPRGRGGRYPPRGRGYGPYGGGYDYYGGGGYPPRGRGRGRYYSPY